MVCFVSFETTKFETPFDREATDITIYDEFKKSVIDRALSRDTLKEFR